MSLAKEQIGRFLGGLEKIGIEPTVSPIAKDIVTPVTGVGKPRAVTVRKPSGTTVTKLDDKIIGIQDLPTPRLGIGDWNNGNGNGNGKIQIQTTPAEVPTPPNPLEHLIPGWGLLRYSEYVAQLQSHAGTLPTQTIEGTPEDIAEYRELVPSPGAPASPGADQPGFGGLSGLGDLSKLLIVAVPVILIVGILGQVKGLFK